MADCSTAETDRGAAAHGVCIGFAVRWWRWSGGSLTPSDRTPITGEDYTPICLNALWGCAWVVASLPRFQSANPCTWRHWNRPLQAYSHTHRLPQRHSRQGAHEGGHTTQLQAGYRVRQKEKKRWKPSDFQRFAIKVRTSLWSECASFCLVYPFDFQYITRDDWVAMYHGMYHILVRFQALFLPWFQPSSIPCPKLTIILRILPN